MEAELKDKLVQLEKQVAVIKDSALRRIAFEKLLDTVVQPASVPRVSRHRRRHEKSRSAAPVKSRVRNKTSAFYSIGQVRETVQMLTLSGTIKGLSNFGNSRKDWEGYMWVLAAAKRNKVEGLNNHEIAYLLTKRLYRPTKYSTVNNIHKKVGSGLVCLDPETQHWMITPDGETHLSSLTGK
jgi:hypothetical protein